MTSHMENSALQSNSYHSVSESIIHSNAQVQKTQRLNLLSMWQRQELTDVILVLQVEPHDVAKEIAAHRVVLSAASPFFHALFTNGMKESWQILPRIPLPGISITAFNELVRYMYMGELTIAGDTILSVLDAANRLELQEVVEICCKQLMLELNVTNCVDIYICCEQLQMRPACRLLAQAARSMIDTFFYEVYQSESFKTLSLEAVMKILRHHEHSVDYCTDDAAVKAWMMHDPMTRQRQVSVVLQSPQKWKNNGNEAGQILTSRWNSDTAMVYDKRKTSLEVEDDMMNLDIVDTEESIKQQLTPTIFVMGGFNNPGALSTVEYLDFHRGEWYPAASMTTRRSYSGVAVTRDNKIFVMGGTSSSSHHHKSMERYDPDTNRWITMPSMKKARSYLGATIVGNFIYIVGGFNGHAHLSSVERFDLEKHEWELMPHLMTGRSGLAVVTLNGLVYAIGGYDGRKHLKSMEVFDPDTNEWISGASMRYARNGPAAIVQEENNSILVFGGESRHGARMNTSEELDLNNGTWTDVDTFADCRSGHVAVSFLNETFLFCMGGSNKKDEYLDTVHRYDFLSKQWTLYSPMNAQRCGLNVAVVKTSPYAECFTAQKVKEQ